MEIPDIVFAPINSKIGFKTVYNLMLTEGLDFNTALDKCIPIKKHWAKILEKQIIKI